MREQHEQASRKRGARRMNRTTRENDARKQGMYDLKAQRHKFKLPKWEDVQ